MSLNSLSFSEELAQDVWASLIRVRAQYQATAKFTTYLYRLAHNRLIDFYRAEGRAEWVSRDADGDTEDILTALPDLRTDQPEVQVESKNIAGRIHAALAALPPAQCARRPRHGRQQVPAPHGTWKNHRY